MELSSDLPAQTDIQVRASVPVAVKKEKALKVIRLSDLTDQNTGDEQIPVENRYEKRKTIPLSKEELKKVWTNIIIHLKNEKNEISLALLLEQLEPDIKDGNVEVAFATKAQKALFEEHLVEIKTRIARTFGSDVDLIRSVNPAVVIKQHAAITAEDQFNDMAERNPVLHDLRKKFGLDFS